MISSQISGLDSDPELGQRKVRSPHITRQFPGDPGAPEQQPREAQPVYYFSMVLN